MPILARLEDLPDDPLRPRAPRRQLHLEAEGATASGQTTQVLILNVSQTGLLLESPVELTEGERIELALPELGTASAQVVWMSERFYGCRLETPLPESVLGRLELLSRMTGSPAPTRPADSLPVRIAQLRKERGLTLDGLAVLLKVSKPTVWAWEQGKARPAPERMAALAKALGVAEDELLTGRDDNALAAALGHARSLVAAAFGVDPARVKVTIEV